MTHTQNTYSWLALPDAVLVEDCGVMHQTAPRSTSIILDTVPNQPALLLLGLKGCADQSNTYSGEPPEIDAEHLHQQAGAQNQ